MSNSYDDDDDDSCQCCGRSTCSMQLELERTRKQLLALLDTATWFKHRGGDPHLTSHLNKLYSELNLKHPITNT